MEKEKDDLKMKETKGEKKETERAGRGGDCFRSGWVTKGV